MNTGIQLTKHAVERSTGRSVPQGVIELILQYGRPVKARDNAEKYSLTKESFKELKQYFGRELSKSMVSYRNVYVVLVGEMVITVARSNSPLQH